MRINECNNAGEHLNSSDSLARDKSRMACMKKGKHAFTLIIALLIVTLLGGCDNTPKTYLGTDITPQELDPAVIGDYGTLKLPLDDQFTKISILCNTSFPGGAESVVVKELRRRLGVNLECIIVPNATVGEKAKVMVANKSTMPDLFSGLSMDTLNDLGMQGAFAPIDDYVNKLPNFKEIFIDNPEKYGTVDKLKNLRAINGKLYMFPSYDVNRDVNHGMLYRKDIFDKHNIPLWNDTEGFYESLKQLKQYYPDSTPFISKTQDKLFRDFGYGWGLDFPKPYYDEGSETWKLSGGEAEFKEVLDFVKRIFDEGLIDPEFLTTTQAVWTSRMTQRDKAFVTWDWIGRLEEFTNQTKSEIPEYDLRYAYPIGSTGKVRSLPKVDSGRVIKDSENSLLAMQVMDYLISESGAILTSKGIKGVTYEDGPDGFARYIGFDKEKGIGIEPLEEKYGLFMIGLYRRIDRTSDYFNFNEREKEAQDLMLNKPGGGFLPEDPILSFTAEEKEKISEYLPAIETASTEFAAKYILSDETGDAAWSAWTERLENALNINELLSIYNEAQKRYNAL